MLSSMVGVFLIKWEACRGLDAAQPGAWQAGTPMPRRSFSFHNIDEMLQPPPPPPQSAYVIRYDCMTPIALQILASADTAFGGQGHL